MAKSYNQKVKMIHILHLLMEKTDENHCLNAADLIVELDKVGIKAERKSIYTDISELMEYGYDIVQVKRKVNGGYYLASRDFEMPELKLLVDAVQSSKFITKKKSTELIKKIEKLTSVYEAKKLQRQVYVTGRIKTDNEGVYDTIDDIHSAIMEQRKIQFQYMEYTITKELKPRRNGQWYVVSPYALIWDQERYYLVGFSEREQEIRHYRVDKIAKTKVLKEKWEGKENPIKFDVAEYSKKVFGMYGGKSEMVTVSFPQSMIGVFIDRFGKEVDIRKRQEEMLSVRIPVVLSGQFYGWLAGLGKDVTILAPEMVKEDYCKYLKAVLESNNGHI